MINNFAVGIDLGTSTSEISVYYNNEAHVVTDPVSQSPIVPSIAAINSKSELVVGESAIPYMGVSGVREVKRLMGTDSMVKLGEKSYKPEAISSLVLRQLKENAESSLGITIKDVVISVPANFDDPARRATLNAGELAGLNVLNLINEPTAAALAFGIQNIDTEEQLVVFDFGGGTLDITILEMMEGILDVKCSYGDAKLGGKDFDDIMIGLIVEKFLNSHSKAQITNKERLILKPYAEKAKINLSKHETHLVKVPNFIVQQGLPIDLEVEITKKDFETAISPLLDRTRDCIAKTLDLKQVKPEAIDRVLLVGGTTYMPIIRNLVAEVFGKEPKADVNPDLAVCMGASVKAAMINGLIDSKTGMIVTDVTSHGVGVEVLGGFDFPLMVYDPLIEPNTTIPYSTKKTYYLVHHEQESLIIKILQDHTGHARFPQDAIDTGIHGRIENIPKSKKEIPHAVEVDFSYSHLGLIQLTASIPETGQKVDISYDPSSIIMSEEEKEESLEDVQELWKTSPYYQENDSLIGKAEKYIEETEGKLRKKLEGALSNLKSSIKKGKETKIESAKNELIDILFEIENQ
ncbi:MAG: Hsp70 family protein [Leptospiraceae bacterium]|nr:Hsp70 family protein [Leptospiraceae bacterium]MCP5496530.1 Hsp70 family protein [Leptospiraceae bacterium]